MDCRAASTHRRRRPKRDGRQTSVGSVHRGELGTNANDQARKHAKAALDLAVGLSQTVGNVARRGNVPEGDRLGGQAGSIVEGRRDPG
jgi:hypothetical protein